MSMIKSHIRYMQVLALLSAIFLSGCQAHWEPSPDFGSSVKDAIRAQAVNPDQPAKTPLNPTGMDGPAAKASIDNYHYSFEQRPGTSSGSGGVNGYGGMVMGSPSSSQSLGVTR
jgi:hypothetical protein